MVTADPFLSLIDSDESGRMSFSSEFLDESNFITICPDPPEDRERGRGGRNMEFEFLSGNLASNMIAADELMSEGKLLPFWQIHHAEKLKKVSLKSDGGEEAAVAKIDRPRSKEERMTWFLDEDPSPRPPKCTVLWKELLKLKKQRPSTLSSSSSSSSSASSSSSSSSSTRISAVEIRKGDEGKKGVKNSEKSSKKTKKLGQSIRIRPVLNVPICTQAAKNAALPPLFSLRKATVER